MKDLQGFTAALNFTSVGGIRLDLTEVACADRRNFLIFLFLMLGGRPGGGRGLTRVTSSGKGSSCGVSHASENGFESTDTAVKADAPFWPVAGGCGWRKQKGGGSFVSSALIIY